MSPPQTFLLCTEDTSDCNISCGEHCAVLYRFLFRTTIPLTLVMGVFTVVSLPQGLSWLKRGILLNFMPLSLGSLFPMTDQYKGINA